MSSNAKLIDAYLAGLGPLQAAVRGLDSDQLRARPLVGMWSTLEVICHIADSDSLFADRMKRVLAEDRPAMAFADPSRYVAALAYQARDAAEEIAYITLLRQQMSRILRAQPADAWQRVGVHSKEGERTLEQLVQKAIDHMSHHLSFLPAKRKALGVN